jgi:hypothetical protein
LPCLVLGLAGGFVALIGATFAPIRRVFPKLGDPIPLVRDPLPLVGRAIALGRCLRAPEDRCWLLVIDPTL